ncbi:MAG: lysophospholipid acyltransferase family protein [Thalassobaculum sp.]|uniref:lysophospholipid acyltransferase family protein n=1 Tax=Thalassobaculum sp. TaxID=2022740 RepID=UPI0032EDE8F1
MAAGRTSALFKRLTGSNRAVPADLPHFSYATGEHTLLKRAVIQLVERLTGQPKLKRLYLEHRLNPVPDEDFWSAAVRKLQLNLVYDRARWDAVPKDGPLVIVANHPFGVLDGIIISYLTSQIRTRFKVLTNSVLFRAPEVQPFLLPIDFAETRAALATNLDSRRQALQELNEGGAVVVFPGGTVSTATPPFGRAYDPDWKPFTSKLIVQARANVVPVFFEGQNSRLFQIASNLSQTARESLLFKEIARRIGSDVPIRIGEVLPYANLERYKDRKELIEYLRRITYELGGADPARRMKVK